MTTETQDKPELQAAPLPVDRPHPDVIESDGDSRKQEHPHEEIIPKDLKTFSSFGVIVAVVLFVVLLVAMFFIGLVPHIKRVNALDKDVKDTENDHPSVVVARPTLQTQGTALYLSGDVQALQQTMIYPRSNGYLAKQYVDIGDKVKNNQLLAEIDTPEVDAQLAQAKATADAARANIAKAQNDFDLAKTTLDRYKGFAQSGGVTQQDLDTRQSNFTQAQSTLENTKAALSSAEADVQRLTALTGFGKIYAPFDGVITARNYDLGALLSSATATPMFGVAQTDVLRTFVNVPQRYATDIRINSIAHLSVVNYPGKWFDGIVARSTDSLDPSTRTIRFQVNFPNAKGDLYAGMYGTVKFDLKPATPPMTVPTSALVFDAEGLHVVTVVDGKAKFVNITTGNDYGTDIEIASGLKPDQLVITNPGERLVDGIQVNMTMAKTDKPAPAAGASAAATSDTKAQIQSSGNLEGTGASTANVTPGAQQNTSTPPNSGGARQQANP